MHAIITLNEAINDPTPSVVDSAAGLGLVVATVVIEVVVGGSVSGADVGGRVSNHNSISLQFFSLQTNLASTIDLVRRTSSVVMKRSASIRSRISSRSMKCSGVFMKLDISISLVDKVPGILKI